MRLEQLPHYAFVICLFILGFAPLSNLHASIYKCVNSKGETYYNDKPCPKADSETEFQAVKDPVNGYIPSTTAVEDQSTYKAGVAVGGDENQQNNEERIKAISEAVSKSSSSSDVTSQSTMSEQSGGSAASNTNLGVGSIPSDSNEDYKKNIGGKPGEDFTYEDEMELYVDELEPVIQVIDGVETNQ